MGGWDIEYSTPKSVSMMVLSDSDIPPTVTDRDQEGAFGKWLRDHIAARKGVDPGAVRIYRLRGAI
jgi:hypothetical protein